MSKIYLISRYLIFASVFILAQMSLFSDPPEQYFPENGDDCVSLDAVFQWSKINDAAYYMIIISESADFSDTLRKNLNLPDSSYSYTLPNYNTKYYWKVGVHIIGEEDEYSDGFELTSRHAPPTPLAPEDALTCLEFDQVFRWSKTPNASQYNVQISKTANFSAVVLDTTLTDTTGTFTVDTYFQNYYWRVRSKVAACTSDWSDVSSFTTVVGPPLLSSPIDSAKGVPLSFNFNWPTTPGAENVVLQLSDMPDFSNLIIDETLGGTETTYPYTLETHNKRYYWRMQTIGDGCNSVWSETETFITSYAAAVGVTPNDTVKCVDLTTRFTWNPVDMATSYRLQASSTETFAEQNILFEANDINDTTIVGNVKNASSRIYWRVRAEDSENIGEWSEIKSFYTTSDSPIPDYPSEGLVEIPRGVTIEWVTLGQSQNFQIQVAYDANFEEIDIDSSGILDKKVSLVLSSYNTVYYYRIRSYFNECFSAWSEVVSFKSIQGFPDLIYPADEEQNITTEVLLEWSKVPTAINYDFRIALDTNFTNGFGQNGVLSNSFSQSGLETNTKYYWKVRSNDQWGTSPWSEVFEFTTGDGFTDIPMLIYPEHNSVKIPVDGIIYWRSSPNANTYLLDVATDRNFENIIISQQTLTDTLYQYTGLDNFTEYHYRVASRNATTTSDYAKARKFRTIALAPSESALAISPANGEGTVPYENLDLRWTKVERTDLGLSGESGYELVVSTKQDFSDTTKYFPKAYNEVANLFKILEPSTTYFWKVRGWNEAGFGPWSEAFSFTTDKLTNVAYGDEYNFGAMIAPNPVQNNAELRFNLEKASTISFVIIDQMGKELFRLENFQANANTNIIPLNFDNISNGKYIFNLQVGNKHQTGKLIISR